MPSVAGQPFEPIEGERWKPLPSRAAYEISDLGRVRRAGRVMRPSITNGYPTVMLKCGAPKRVYLHREILRAFVGEPPTPEHECGHRDGDRANCRLDNLRWITSAENKADAKRHGTLARGEKAGPKGHKCSIAIVRRVRNLRERGLTQRVIAELVGFGQTHISKILSREIWGWVE